MINNQVMLHVVLKKKNSDRKQKKDKESISFSTFVNEQLLEKSLQQHQYINHNQHQVKLHPKM